MRFCPRVYQELIRNYALDRPRCNIFAGMGMGKTTAAIDLFDTLHTFGEARHALVLAPRRVAVSTWPGEIAKWRESFGHLNINAAIGSPAQRIEALKRRGHITTINYDNLPWLVDVLGDHWYFDTVLADESTHLKGLRISLQTHKLSRKEFIRGQGSSRAKAIAKVAHKRVRRWHNWTGSPAPNGLQDLWGQNWFVDGGARLGASFSDFSDRYFESIPNGDFGSRLVLRPFAEEQIHARIKDVCITVDPRDYFDIDAVIERPVYVDLPPKVRRVYDDMERELFAEVMHRGERQELEAFNSASKSNKCLQIASGAVYVGDKGSKEWAPLHDEKIEALRSVASEANGESILVRYEFQHERDRVLKAFPKFRKFDDNPRTLDDWNAGRIPGLVTHAKSAGHGLSMQDGGRILVDFTTGWNLEHDEQIIERVGPVRQAQSGHKRNVFRYRICARDTIEENSTIPRLVTKATVQDSLKEAMKLRA